MKINKNQPSTKKFCSIVILAITLLITLFQSVLNPFCFVSLVWAADSYGNDLLFVEIYSYNGSDWDLVGNCTAASGESYRVTDSWPIKFLVNMQFNSSLAVSTAEAISYTRIYMNITYTGGTIWSNEELNNTACVLDGSFYELEEEGVWNQTGYPVAGVEYECTVDYDGYY